MELKKPSRLPALKMPTKSSIFSFLLLNLGLFLTALGISLFKTPNHFAIGGVADIGCLVLCVLSTLLWARIAARFANKAKPATLNRATGVVLSVLGVVMIVVNYL